MKKYINIIIILTLSFNSDISHASEEVNVYSARKEHLIRPLINNFERETGIKVNILTAKSKVLIKKIIDEGSASPADVLITVDAGNLFSAKEKGISKTINSSTLTK